MLSDTMVFLQRARVQHTLTSSFSLHLYNTVLYVPPPVHHTLTPSFTFHLLESPQSALPLVSPWYDDGLLVQCHTAISWRGVVTDDQVTSVESDLGTFARQVVHGDPHALLAALHLLNASFVHGEDVHQELHHLTVSLTLHDLCLDSCENRKDM